MVSVWGATFSGCRRADRKLTAATLRQWSRKNDRTRRRFKALVRILKRLRDEMSERPPVGINSPKSLFIESLVWNAPDYLFGHATFTEDVRGVLGFLVTNTADAAACAEWGEEVSSSTYFEGDRLVA